MSEEFWDNYVKRLKMLGIITEEDNIDDEYEDDWRDDIVIIDNRKRRKDY